MSNFIRGRHAGALPPCLPASFQTQQSGPRRPEAGTALDGDRSGQASTPHPRGGLGWVQEVGAGPGLWAASPSHCLGWAGGLVGTCEGSLGEADALLPGGGGTAGAPAPGGGGSPPAHTLAELL